MKVGGIERSPGYPHLPSISHGLYLGLRPSQQCHVDHFRQFVVILCPRPSHSYDNVFEILLLCPPFHHHLQLLTRLCRHMQT